MIMQKKIDYNFYELIRSFEFYSRVQMKLFGVKNTIPGIRSPKLLLLQKFKMYLSEYT